MLGSWRASNRRPHSTTPAPDLVVEGLLEDQARKLAIFEPLDQICPCPAVLASSSGRPVSRLAERVRRRHKGGAVAVFATARQTAYDHRFRIRRLAALSETARTLGYTLVPNVAAGGGPRC